MQLKPYILLFLTYMLTYSQYELDFSGYISTLPIYQINNEQISQLYNLNKTQFLDLSRIRLRPTIYLWDNSRINIEYEISSIYFNSEGIIPYTTDIKNKRQLLELNWNLLNEDHFIANHFIDRLYFYQGFEFGELRIGRQRISWGTGRIWNPNDLFNPINPASFYKMEKDGADVLLFKLFLDSFSDLHFVFNPQEKFKESNYAVRYRTNFSEFDFSLIAGKFDSQIVGGIDFAGNLLDAGVRGEFLFSFKNGNLSGYFVKSILGIDYQFTPALYALLEYHYNGQGTADKMNYQFEKLISGEILNLNQNYIFSMLNYIFSPLLNISISNNTNINDGSGYFGIIGNYSWLDNLDLGMGIQLSYGSIFSEYWYYPTSIYLQGNLYF